MLPHGNATETATAYIQRCQKAKKPLSLPELLTLTGWEKPAAFRFMQDTVTATKPQLSESRSAARDSERRRNKTKRSEEAPELQGAAPCASSDSTMLADNLRRFLDAIG